MFTEGKGSSVRLPSVIEADNNEVAGPAAVAFSHGRAAVVMQDLLVNSQGGNALPKPAGNLFGKLLIGSGRGVTAVNLAAYAAAHPAAGLEPGNRPR